jgi:hypothetical protein
MYQNFIDSISNCHLTILYLSRIFEFMIYYHCQLFLTKDF